MDNFTSWNINQGTNNQFIFKEDLCLSKVFATKISELTRVFKKDTRGGLIIILLYAVRVFLN